MFVSRKSWHYRLHCFVFTFFNWETYSPVRAFKAVFGKATLWEHQPKSLCSYFWSTTLLTALFPLITVILAVGVIGIAPFVALFLGGEWVYDKYRSWRPKKGQTRTGLAAQYLAARKSKVCPLITIVD